MSSTTTRKPKVIKVIKLLQKTNYSPAAGT